MENKGIWSLIWRVLWQFIVVWAGISIAYDFAFRHEEISKWDLYFVAIFAATFAIFPLLRAIRYILEYWKAKLEQEIKH